VPLLLSDLDWCTHYSIRLCHVTDEHFFSIRWQTLHYQAQQEMLTVEIDRGVVWGSVNGTADCRQIANSESAHLWYLPSNNWRGNLHGARFHGNATVTYVCLWFATEAYYASEVLFFDPLLIHILSDIQRTHCFNVGSSTVLHSIFGWNFLSDMSQWCRST